MIYITYVPREGEKYTNVFIRYAHVCGEREGMYKTGLCTIAGRIVEECTYIYAW